MKKTIIYSTTILMLTLGMVSCSKTDDNQPNNNVNTEKVTGSWIVTYYFDKDKDETDMYSGYAFVFDASGVLSVTFNNSTFEGSWSIISDDGVQKLVINIMGNDALVEITDDWVIQSINDNRIQLKDDNSVHLEELIFERL